MMDLSRKESYQGHAFEHGKGNKLLKLMLMVMGLYSKKITTAIT